MKSFKQHLEEKLKVSDGLGAWIKDFQDSDAPQFKDADSKKRRDMAIAAFTAAGGKLDEEIDLQERPFGGDSVLKDLMPGIYRFLDRTVNNKRYQFAVRMFLDLRKKNPKDARNNLIKAAKIADVDVRVLDRLFRDMVKKGVMPKHLMNYYPTFVEFIEEGSETWEAGYKRRVVKTTKPEHKEKGYNWRIKGKDRPEISIKLYKDKPSFKEFTKQMKRVAGHEFGG